MSKKKLKKLLRKAIKSGSGTSADAIASAKYGSDLPNGFGPANKNRFDSGLLGGLGLRRGFGSGQTEQFVIGALLGATAAYVLSDDALRSKVMKSVMKLYAGLTGGIEEFKEQIADLKAEIEAEHHDPA